MSTLEKSPFLQKLQKVWAKENHDYVISYIKAACKVKVDEDLLFLVELKTVIKTL